MSIYAVNGKTPIAAWIPSRDTAGNGTTKLTDLVGSNNGTLTNMDVATDWVADTGAGGVRALDFDGVNDYVQCGVSSPVDIAMSGGFSIAVWINPSELSGGDTFGTTNPRTIAMHFNGSLFETANYLFRLIGGRLDLTYRNAADTGYVSQQADSHGVVIDEWQHVAAVHTGSAMVLYRNGTAVASTLTGDATQDSIATTGRSLRVGYSTSKRPRAIDGRLDDLRIFDQALTADDISYLYNSGNGRGITAATGTIQTRRRRDLGGFGL